MTTPICDMCAKPDLSGYPFLTSMRSPRRITITGDDVYTRDYQACERCGGYLSDSEILHDFLFVIDPGSTYSVSFVNIPVV